MEEENTTKTIFIIHLITINNGNVDGKVLGASDDIHIANEIYLNEVAKFGSEPEHTAQYAGSNRCDIHRNISGWTGGYSRLHYVIQISQFNIDL